MAAADTARLIATLELQDKNFTKNIDKMTKSLGGLGAKSTAVGTAVGIGIERLAEKGIGFLFGQIREGNATLVELQEISAATGAVIESTGGKAGVTAQQVRDLSESLEDLTTADDKVIQSGQNMLLTFTNIGSETFPRATKAMVDMAIAMNNGSTEGLDLESTAIQIGKALQDPIKGITALRRVGVAFTKEQEKQIKVLVESGDLMGAQALILSELETEFGKAGEAAGKAGGASGLRRFQDSVEDAQLALANGLAPALDEIRGDLTKALANPQTQADIKNFGKGLGEAARSAIAFAKTVPWEQIGSGLRTAADWAGRLFKVFTSLPPQVQGTILALAGLNKLSGGAVGGLISELGKGLIKGVLGMTAGVVNVRGAVVNGPGGVGTGAAAAGGAASRLGTAVRILGTVALAAGSIALIGELLAQKGAQTAVNQALAGNLATQTTGFTGTASLEDMKKSLAGIEAYTYALTYGDKAFSAEGLAYALNIDGVRTAIDNTKSTLRDSIAAVQSSVSLGARDEVFATRSAAAASREAAAAIRDKDMSPRITVKTNVNVSTSVSVRDQVRKTRSAVATGTSYGIS